MLSTGVRTPIGVKIFGPDLKTIQGLGERLESILRDVRARAPSSRAHGRRLLRGLRLHRDELARYGLTIDDAQMIITSAIGARNVTTTVEGRERYR